MLKFNWLNGMRTMYYHFLNWAGTCSQVAKEHFSVAGFVATTTQLCRAHNVHTAMRRILARVGENQDSCDIRFHCQETRIYSMTYREFCPAKKCTQKRRPGKTKNSVMFLRIQEGIAKDVQILPTNQKNEAIHPDAGLSESMKEIPFATVWSYERMR